MSYAECAAQNFLNGCNCAQAVLLAFSDLTKLDPDTARRIASGFGGGMARMREVCGAVSGMFMAAGLLYGSCMVLLQLTTPLVNALGIATVSGGEKMNFGIARGFGSLGYAVAAYVIGLLAQRFGAVCVPVT